MHRYSMICTALLAFAAVANFASTSGCGGERSRSGFDNLGNGSSGASGGGSTGSGGGSSSGSGSTGLFGSTSSGGSRPSSDAGVPCPAGLRCNVSCPGGGTTSVTGQVYDPARKNHLYNIAVYVPASPLQPLPRGVPTGADACSCEALYKSGALTGTVTGIDGSFTLTNVPAGSSVPLVVQVGKWRHSAQINVTACQDNPQPDKSLALPGTPADPDDSLPDIAVSTGNADTLECLMTRIGVPASEYVPGPGGNGHIHVFAGGWMGNGTAYGGRPEKPPTPGAPPSDMALWDSKDDMMPYDITLLSCEGAETYDAKPDVLEAYLNAGGRVFSSHYHYAWFAGSMGYYSPPMDWGPNLATWVPGNNNKTNLIGGTIVTTLNGSTMPFPKGVALQKWLQLVGGLNGAPPVPAGELTIYQPRYNAVVGPMNKPSQPWILSDQMADMPSQTMYFSFDTPVQLTPPTGPDPSGTAYCGRAVFSDLHVSSGGAPGLPVDNTSGPPPGGCVMGDLSPQEKALEFMLFDLSSCVIPDTVTPPTTIPVPPQ